MIVNSQVTFFYFFAHSVQLFYAVKTNCYNKGLYVYFSLFLPKAFFYPARQSAAKSEQPINVYWIILQVGLIKG